MNNGQDLIGRLPKAFIGVAFFNFLIGAGLGGWMSSQPALWPSVGPIHGELNPFGWLTTLIYGMTYAVLTISTGLRPPKAWVGWAHLAASELAVVMVSCAFLSNQGALFKVGLTAQFIAPVLFLVNILSAVFSGRRERKASEHHPISTDGGESHSLAFLRRGPAYRETDRVAQRGTDVSLMLFIAGALWMLINALSQGSSLDLSSPNGALYLVYYGWIAGTVFAVSLHLFPRFLPGTKFIPKTAGIWQIVWGLAIVVGAVGCGFANTLASTIGYRMLGVALIGFSLNYLISLVTYTRSRRVRTVHLPVPSLVAWMASWAFCLILGGGLLFGLDPFSLVALHLMFLAFATNLVYGVGYALFPVFLNRKMPSKALATVQISAAIIGVLLMLISFLDLQFPAIGLARPFTALGIGGPLAAVSAIVFLVQWMISKPA